MTDFNFLRIKWPKLAAIAADASRLVEVSPASAISTMQNFCEWAADIALDFYEINTQNGITQQEKIDTLKATGHVPTEILERFRDVMMAGGRRLYRANEDVEEARRCIDDVYELGRWLNKEADRAGWPPRNDYYRPVISPLGSPGDGGGYATGKIGQAFNNFKPIIIMAAAVIVIGGLATWGILSVTAGGKAKESPKFLTPTPTVTLSPTSMVVTMPGDGPTATPAPETVVFLDTLKPTKTRQTFFLKQWKFQSGEKTFAIGDNQYQNGIGMYIASKDISRTQGTDTMKFTLDGEYDKLRFDLGVDSNLQYKEGYGKFRIQIFCDSDKNDPVYDTGGLKEYKFTELGVEVSIKDCNTLIIKLTEQKGSKGTINVVLGNIRLVKGGEGTQETTGTTATADATGSADPSATATATEGDQEMSPEST